jgi:hypothetical protein
MGRSGSASAEGRDGSTATTWAGRAVRGSVSSGDGSGPSGSGRTTVVDLAARVRSARPRRFDRPEDVASDDFASDDFASEDVATEDFAPNAVVAPVDAVVVAAVGAAVVAVELVAGLPAAVSAPGE